MRRSRGSKVFIPCCEKCLPTGQMVAAAARAVEHNPANAPARGFLAHPQMIAVLTTKFWGAKGRAFGVTFLDNPTAACRAKILAHMNAWNQWCNVSFAESSQGEVRIARANSGYWSYLGTDILSIPAGQPTMNLQAFTENTPDSEYRRVVRHETGHTLGCPHEHMRAEIVNLLDANKTVAYFEQTQGWSQQEVIQQVLTPVSESALTGATAHAEPTSIMCYQLPGSITKNGQPVVGGVDITPTDAAAMAKLYPKAPVPVAPPVSPPPVAPPTGDGVSLPVSIAVVTTALAGLGYKVSKS